MWWLMVKRTKGPRPDDRPGRPTWWDGVGRLCGRPSWFCAATCWLLLAGLIGSGGGWLWPTAAARGGEVRPEDATDRLADDGATDEPLEGIDGEEFFEREIRPILTQHCAQCHARGEESESGLQLDSREHLLHGGERGAAIVPGDPEQSMLIQAVRGEHDELSMPPEEELPPEKIEKLARWVRLGAPWPQGTTISPPHVYWNGQLSPADRGYWAFQPIEEPALPEVRDESWPITPIDRFVLARLEAEGLRPAPQADRRTLLRRVTFDLTGLPPTPEEMDAFLNDTSPDAWQRVVERLLDSPHYGERWGRHWLDVVRFAETNGLDNDYPKPNAWRYRDYVIRAFNDDLPYDQFVREHVAGDLLPKPRVSRDGLLLESPIATAHYWFGEMLNVPVDQTATLARELENRIDVFGKAFLGLTIACARCHNHKFDPIFQTDYYALAGFFNSTTNVQACVDSPEGKRQIEEAAQRIAELNDRMAGLLHGRAIERARAERRLAEAARAKQYLLAAREVLRLEETKRSAAIETIAAKHGVPAGRLAVWVEAVDQAAARHDPVLYAWQQLIDAPDMRFKRRARALAARLAKWNQQIDASLDGEVLADFEGETFAPWQAEGAALATGPSHVPEPQWFGWRGKGFASSYRGSDAFTGRLVSPRFKVEKQHLSFLLCGNKQPERISVNVLLNSQVLHEPEDVMATGDDVPWMVRKQFNLEAFRGQEIMLEIVDESTDGHVVVDHLTFSDELPPPPEWVRTNGRVVSLMKDVDSPTVLAERLAGLFQEVLRQWRETLDENLAAAESSAEGARLASAAWRNVNDRDVAELRHWLLHEQSLLAGDDEPRELLSDQQYQQLAAWRAARRQIEAALRPSALAIVSRDIGSVDERLHLHGDPHNLGDVVPRGFPRVLAPEGPPHIEQGSGRLLLADWIASPDNPLTARVMVNRIWQHHFGTGLVATVDNFGRLGERPSHPELLDYLARRFIESGWSIKAMHRLMLTSRTYLQSSIAAPEALEIDPANRLLHHMPRRRLEAECIRDGLLAVAGQLNRKLYGPSVPVHLTPFMQGEDLPLVSGPVDGDCRRSIYLEVRRNHLTPLLETFDFPKPESAAGRRNTALLPVQALAMLNNEFIAQQSASWAERLLRSGTSQAERIARLYRDALARDPSSEEVARCRRFLEQQRAAYLKRKQSPEAAQRQAWNDLCHVIFNLEEFIFIR